MSVGLESAATATNSLRVGTNSGRGKSSDSPFPFSSLGGTRPWRLAKHQQEDASRGTLGPISFKFLVVGAPGNYRQILYVAPAGATQAAVFESVEPLADRVVLKYKPFGFSKTVTPPFPLRTDAPLGRIGEEFRKLQGLAERPWDLNALSFAWQDKRVETFVRIPETVVSLASIPLSVLTLNELGALAAAGRVSQGAAAAWALFQGLTTTAGLVSDISQVLQSDLLIAGLASPVERNRARIALAVVNAAASLGVLELAKDPGEAVQLLKKAHRALAELRLRAISNGSLPEGSVARLEARLEEILAPTGDPDVARRASLDAAFLADEVASREAGFGDVLARSSNLFSRIGKFFSRTRYRIWLLLSRSGSDDFIRRFESAFERMESATDTASKLAAIEAVTDLSNPAYFKGHPQLAPGNCRFDAFTQILLLSTETMACALFEHTLEDPEIRGPTNFNIFKESFGVRRSDRDPDLTLVGSGAPISPGSPFRGMSFEQVFAQLDAFLPEGGLAKLGTYTHDTAVAKIGGELYIINNQGWRAGGRKVVPFPQGVGIFAAGEIVDVTEGPYNFIVTDQVIPFGVTD